MADLLFVYGTLRRTARSPEARLLADLAVHRGPASVRGRIYRIDDYPGLVLSDDPADLVAGDLFAFEDRAVLAWLDGYEGCGPEDAEPQEYRRARIAVETGDGTVEAWAYLYNWPIDGLAWIAGGDFLAAQEPSPDPGR